MYARTNSLAICLKLRRWREAAPGVSRLRSRACQKKVALLMENNLARTERASRYSPTE